MKNMIFHIPFEIDYKNPSGSQIRPQRILEAFKDIGYSVDVVSGNCTERKKAIKIIKNAIISGKKYDFLYSESSTMPTALTESHHFPMSPFLDFSFLKFCRKSNIKVGLFYRDIYWIFDEYKNRLSLLKRMVTEFFYYFDLRQYNKSVDILYLPSKKMHNYFPVKFRCDICALPPASVATSYSLQKKVDAQLNFIYVGGLGVIYNLHLFCATICPLDNIALHLCVRERDWNESRSDYAQYKNITVHHKSGAELDDVYRECDIAVYFLHPSELWTFAMGVKLFEYLSYRKPMIAVKGTAVGEFVEKNNIGWVINYDENELKALVISLQENPEQIDEKIANIEKILPNNTWQARVEQVAEDLSQ